MRTIPIWLILICPNLCWEPGAEEAAARAPFLPYSRDLLGLKGQGPPGIRKQKLLASLSGGRETQWPHPISTAHGTPSEPLFVLPGPALGKHSACPPAWAILPFWSFTQIIFIQPPTQSPSFQIIPVNLTFKSEFSCVTLGKYPNFPSLDFLYKMRY